MEHFAAGRGGQTLQCGHFGGSKALAAELGVDQLAMSGARGGVRRSRRRPGPRAPRRPRAPGSRASSVRSSALCCAGLPAPASRCLGALSAMDVSPAFREAPGVREPLSSRRRALNSCPVAPGGAARCAPSRRLRPTDSRPPPSPPPRPSAAPPSEAA